MTRPRGGVRYCARLVRAKLAIVSVCLALPAAALGLSACGGVPGNAVAKVDGETISKSEFDHWMKVATLSQSPNPNGVAVVPDSPNFTKCIADKAKQQPKTAKGKPNTTQLKAQCKAQYEQTRNQVMGFLISYEWLKKEAKDLGVKVTDKDVQKSFDQQKKAAFPKPADFQKFLKSSGMNEDDLHKRVELDLLQTKITEKVRKDAKAPTQAEIAAYFKKNEKQFAQPERRDVQLIQTKTEEKANAAKAEIEAGASFKATVKKYSVDAGSKQNDGKLQNLVRGQQEKAVDDAIFKAKRGVIIGPIKSQFGWYVLKVNQIYPPAAANLAKSTNTIKSTLLAQKQQAVLDKFVKGFEKKWKDKTECQKGFLVQNCKNAPKPKTKSGGGATSTTGG